MAGYSAGEVAKILDLSVARIRAYVRAGFIAPERGTRGEYRLSFQDLVLLRTAKGLIAARIPARRVRAALLHLKAQLPTGRPLSGVQVSAEGDQIVVRDGDALWQPESGQALFNFEVSELARKVAPLARRAHARAQSAQHALRAEDWFVLGIELEISSPSEARDAYRRALELDPENVEARLNLGRLLHEAGEASAAEAHYRMALDLRPDDATAAFNLGVALEDQERLDDAVKAYLVAIASEPDYSDAYYNLAHLYERLEEPALALRYLKSYKRLTEP